MIELGWDFCKQSSATDFVAGCNGCNEEGSSATDFVADVNSAVTEEGRRKIVISTTL
jgi:hypothetical protein